MKKSIVSAVLLSSISSIISSIGFASTVSAVARNGSKALEVPFCPSTQAQLAGQPGKASNLRYAQEAATRYYAYMNGAIRELLSQGRDRTVCSQILVVGKNDAFPGLTKLKYLIRYEVSENGKLVGALPVFMVNTSEQGHMNPGEKQWMALDPAKVRAAMNLIVKKATPTIVVDNAPDILSPEFPAFLMEQPIGRMMVAPENTMVMSLGKGAAGQYYLLTAFYEIVGMYEKHVSMKALLFLRGRDGKLRVGTDIDAYREVMTALGEARKPVPATPEDHVRETLRGATDTRLID